MHQQLAGSLLAGLLIYIIHSPLLASHKHPADKAIAILLIVLFPTIADTRFVTGGNLLTRVTNVLTIF